MKNRWFRSMGAPAIVGALAWVTVSSAVGPTAAQAPARKATALPRTPWGDPDLQGTWTSEGELGIPFERAAEFGTRQLLTDEEFVQRQRQSERQLQTDNSDFELESADISNAGQVGSATPPPHWLERGRRRGARRRHRSAGWTNSSLKPQTAVGAGRQLQQRTVQRT